MGIDPAAYTFLQYCTRERGLGHTLTLGRQEVRGIGHLYQDAYCEELLIRDFGATKVDSIDSSNYENSTFIHDFNQPLSPQLQRIQFDSILDFGTLEHIFNVPLALQSISSLCRQGGQIIHGLVSNDYLGHGFYQFSPELFFGVYNKSNGFSEPDIFLVSDYADWYEVKRPGIGESINLEGRAVPQSAVLVRTTKLAQMTRQDIQQNFYAYDSDTTQLLSVGTSLISTGLRPRNLVSKTAIEISKKILKPKYKRVLKSLFVNPYDHPLLTRVNMCHGARGDL